MADLKKPLPKPLPKGEEEPFNRVTVRVAMTAAAIDQGMELPTYQSPDASGFDLMASLFDTMVLHPQHRLLIPTGLIFALPRGYEGQIRSRSGLAYKDGLQVLNSPGTIDSDFRGEVMVLLFNSDRDKAFTIEPKMRIAQFVVVPVAKAGLRMVELEELDKGTQRGGGGFGSTGING